MDFTFTSEQQMLRDGLSRYLAQHHTFEQRRARQVAGSDSGLWQQLADMGVLALPLPESAGGLGGSVADIVAIADLFGRHLANEPFATGAVLAARALALGGDAAMLEAIAGGTATAAFAHEEGRGTALPDQLAATFDGSTVSGAKTLVLGAPGAAVLVVSARHGEGHALVAVDAGAGGVTLTPYRTIDGREAADVTFDGAPATLLTTDRALIEGLIAETTIVLCAEAVGAMEALLEQTSAYAATRKQFGQPIGAFQAIAHRLADMKIACVKARATLLYTTALAEAGTATSRDVSLLKAQAGRLGRAVAESAVQIHGGVGMTDELAIGHFLKRILAVDALFGDSEFHLRAVGAPPGG